MGQREEGHVAARLARLAHLARSEYHSEETSLDESGWVVVGCSVKMPFIILGSTDRPTQFPLCGTAGQKNSFAQRSSLAHNEGF